MHNEFFTPELEYQGSRATGAFILTASHNPGGPNEVNRNFCVFFFKFVFYIFGLGLWFLVTIAAPQSLLCFG